MRVDLPLILIAGTLAGCAATQEVGRTPPGVSYRFSGDNIGEANARADRYCQQYGARARLQGVNRGAADNIAVFSCG